MANSIRVLVEGGKATPAPPLGPALGPMGLNIGKVVGDINQKTKEYAGMKVPVIVTADPKNRGEYTLEVGTPPTTALVLSSLNKDKGAQKPKEEVVGSIKMDDVVNIAKRKQKGMINYNLKNAAKEVVGTCRSMGVNVDDKFPQDVIEEINSGKFDNLFE